MINGKTVKRQDRQSGIFSRLSGVRGGSGLSKGKNQGVRKRPDPFNLLMAGDLGLEPRTFGSGDQRSILLS
jgi:hypothetical protein